MSEYTDILSFSSGKGSKNQYLPDIPYSFVPYRFIVKNINEPHSWVTLPFSCTPCHSATMSSKGVLIYCWKYFCGNVLFSLVWKNCSDEKKVLYYIAQSKKHQISLHLLCHRHWDREVQMATKELRKPQLSKAIIKCYWKPYAVLGFFTLLEVGIISSGNELKKVYNLLHKYF